MSSKHRSKIECINISDDDSANEQPPVKSKKRNADQISSREMIELQKKVIELKQKNAKLEKDFQKNRELEEKVIELQHTVTKLENNYQGACRLAGEAKKRVKDLERLIDSTPKDIDVVSNEELEKRVYNLTKQLEKERMSHRARIDDLTAKLAQYEGLPQPSYMQQPHQQQAAAIPSLMQQKVPATTQPPLLQPLQHPAATMLTEMLQPLQLPQQQPAVVQSRPMQQPQQEKVQGGIKANSVKIRAKFTNISELARYKVIHSRAVEHAGITWKMSVHEHYNGTQLCLEAEKKNAIRWSFPVSIELQLFSQKSDNYVPIKTIKNCYFSSHTPRNFLIELAYKHLFNEAYGYVKDDSIMFNVVITTLSTN